MHTATPAAIDDAPIERLAHRRARAKLGWYLHACIYVLINLVLAFASARSAHAWTVYPALGWGLGLLMHGAGVWLGLPGSSLYQQLLDRERAQLQRRP